MNETEFLNQLVQKIRDNDARTRGELDAIANAFKVRDDRITALEQEVKRLKVMKGFPPIKEVGNDYETLLVALDDPRKPGEKHFIAELDLLPPGKPKPASEPIQAKMKREATNMEEDLLITSEKIRQQRKQAMVNEQRKPSLMVRLFGKKVRYK